MVCWQVPFLPHVLYSDCRELSWAAATERLLAAASIHKWPGALAQAWDDCLWVPYRLFALLFRGARQAFAAAPKLLPELELQIQLEPQQQQQQQLQTCTAVESLILSDGQQVQSVKGLSDVCTATAMATFES